MVLFLIDGDPDPMLNMFGAAPAFIPNWVAFELGAPKVGATELLNDELDPKAGAEPPPEKLKFGLFGSDAEEALPNEKTPGLLVAFELPKLKTDDAFDTVVLEPPKGVFA